MKLKQIYLAIALVLMGFATSVATPSVVTQEREVISSGGGTSTSPGTAYSNFSVVGEPVVGVVTSGAFQGSTHGFIADFPKQTNAPVATSYFPAVNSIIDAVDVYQLAITFDEPITLGTIGSLILKKISSTDEVIVRQFNISDVVIIGNQLIANMSNLTTPLLAGSSYSVHIDGGFVKDLDSNDFVGINNDVDWKFSIPVAAPTNQPTISVYNKNRNSVTLNIGTGSSDSKVLIVASKNSIFWTPSNANEYLSSTAYAQSPANTSLVTGGQVYAVYNGSDSRIVVTGLTKSTTYYFKAFAYNGITGNFSTYLYNTNGVEVSTRTGSKEDGEYQIGEKEFTGNFSVCKVNPNPVNTELNFCIDAQEEANFTIELFNVSGEKVFSQVQFLKSGSNSMKVDLATQAAGVSAGTYFLKVTANDESLTQQVVVIP